MKYHATVGGEERVVRLTGDGLVLGEGADPVEAELARLPDGRTVHLRLGNRALTFHATRVEGGWALERGGRRIVVAVEDERTRAIREIAGVPAPGAGDRDVRAPMPGLVVRVLVEPGQEVEAGAPLLVVEAMKMENEVRAQSAGTVAAVEVEEGQSVNQEDVLVTFE